MIHGYEELWTRLEPYSKSAEWRGAMSDFGRICVLRESPSPAVRKAIESLIEKNEAHRDDVGQHMTRENWRLALDALEWARKLAEFYPVFELDFLLNADGEPSMVIHRDGRWWTFQLAEKTGFVYDRNGLYEKVDWATIFPGPDDPPVKPNADHLTVIVRWVSVYVVCSNMENYGTVDAVFTTESEAKRFIENFGNESSEIREMCLDPDHSTRVENGESVYDIFVRRDSVGVVPQEHDFRAVDPGYWFMRHDPQGQAVAFLCRWAKDESDAIRQGEEWRKGYLAAGNAWPDPVAPEPTW